MLSLSSPEDELHFHPQMEDLILLNGYNDIQHMQSRV